MVAPRFASHVRGTGPIVIEIWLDYVCPFSAKIFFKLHNEVIDEVEKQYPNRFSWVFQHQVQPWHPQSTLTHEAAITLGLLEPKQFWNYSKVLFEHIEDFYDDKVVDKSRSAIIKDLAVLSEEVGIDSAKLLKILSTPNEGGKNGGYPATFDLKQFVKLGRQNGIHVSPTVLIDGLAAADVSSSWETSQWLEKLKETTRLSNTHI